MGFKVTAIKLLDAHTSSSTIVTNLWSVNQKQEAKSYAKLDSAFRKPSTFGLKMILLASLTYILIWHRHTIFSVTWRMLS